MGTTQKMQCSTSGASPSQTGILNVSVVCWEVGLRGWVLTFWIDLCCAWDVGCGDVWIMIVGVMNYELDKRILIWRSFFMAWQRLAGDPLSSEQRFRTRRMRFLMTMIRPRTQYEVEGSMQCYHFLPIQIHLPRSRTHVRVRMTWPQSSTQRYSRVFTNWVWHSNPAPP
jgi:hypothetical protein